MPNNYVLLETIALTQSAASVTFDNIPQTGYTDLVVKVSWRTTAAVTANIGYITFNANTTGYSHKFVQGDGASAGSSGYTGANSKNTGIIPGSSATANTFSSNEIYIPNYTGSNYKSYSVDSTGENNAATSYAMLLAGLWSNAAAITSIKFEEQNGATLTQYSTFSLYGVAALGTTPVLAPKATGGNIVANDGTYWYHAFTSSGNFVPQVGLTADVLVVAGGGAGGSAIAGGGGAGGVLGFGSQSLTNGNNYACTIGAGGAGAANGSYANGLSGSNSQFGSLTASIGGGFGTGAGSTATGGTGGSGGGGNGGGTRAGGAGTSGQGNAGATSQLDTRGGGGGGYASAGSAATGGTAATTVTNWGSISAALSATSLGVSGALAGGGGAGGNNNGAQGNGGGGGATAGTTSTANAGNATINTGSGAGGGGNIPGVGGAAGAGGSGGSGIVIIRYTIA